VELTSPDSGEVRADVDTITLHPDYDPATLDNDVAAIKLKNPEVMVCDQATIWPACLPVKGNTYAGSQDTLGLGWGATQALFIPGVGSISFGTSATLLKAQLIPVSNAECTLAMGRRKNRQRQADGRITEKMLCAGNEEEMSDTCQGDSGGPLISRGEAGGYSLVGITSWGDGCAVPGTFGVYSRVTELIDWVAQQYGYTGIG